jgi:hypothetical protein
MFFVHGAMRTRFYDDYLHTAASEVASRFGRELPDTSTGGFVIAVRDAPTQH